MIIRQVQRKAFRRSNQPLILRGRGPRLSQRPKFFLVRDLHTLTVVARVIIFGAVIYHDDQSMNFTGRPRAEHPTAGPAIGVFTIGPLGPCPLGPSYTHARPTARTNAAASCKLLTVR